MSVFLGHSRVDTLVALALSEAFGRTDVSSWIAERNMGRLLSKGISDGINRCHVFLAILSSDFDTCSWCEEEITYARSKGKMIYALRIEDYVPDGPAGLHTAKLFQYCIGQGDEFEVLYEQLISDVKKDVKKAKKKGLYASSDEQDSDESDSDDATGKTPQTASTATVATPQTASTATVATPQTGKRPNDNLTSGQTAKRKKK